MTNRTNAILTGILSCLKNGEELCDLQKDCYEQEADFNTRYEVDEAIKANRHTLERLWSALGSNLNYDIRVFENSSNKVDSND